MNFLKTYFLKATIAAVLFSVTLGSAALKDPHSGNLDRIQVIKGWTNKTTSYSEEKIYDAAWSDNRKIDAKTGILQHVGNSVDVKTATYTNDIGECC